QAFGFISSLSKRFTDFQSPILALSAILAFLHMTDGRTDLSKKPIRVLLLDDHPDNLIMRSAILRSHGYEAISSASVEEAETHLGEIDIAVLDYHLGAGKFGTEVAQSLRDKRPEVPIIILPATLERKFG